VLITLAALAAVVVLLRAVLPGLPTSTGALPEIATTPLFAAGFPDADGRMQAISQWQGKVLVVNFWATWCPPCREEMPELSALQEKYRDRGLVVLGISTDDAAKMQQFARVTPVTYPLLSGDFDAMSLASGLGNGKGVLPYTVVIRRDGGIANSYFGRLDLQVLEHDLAPILKASP
jgi:peroxiredoxin